MKKNIWERMNSVLYFMCIILGFLVLAQVVVSAPVVNPYDNYNLTTYNCLDIAMETQEWYEFNGIKTNDKSQIEVYHEGGKITWPCFCFLVLH